MTEFDSIIIGSGQAAPSLAAGLARRGETVALVEGDRLGGTCVNPAARRPRPSASRRALPIWRAALRISASQPARSR